MFLVIWFILAYLEDLSKFSKSIHFLVRPQQILANLLKFYKFRNYSNFIIISKSDNFGQIHDIFLLENILDFHFSPKYFVRVPLARRLSDRILLVRPRKFSKKK